MYDGRLRQITAVALRAHRRAHVLHAEMLREGPRDRLERAGQQCDRIAAPQVLLQPLDGRLEKPRHSLARHEVCRQRRDVGGREPDEIRLVLLRDVNAVARQESHQEPGASQDLPRPLAALREQVAPEAPLRAAAYQGAVDVEDRERHCFLPGRRRISFFCE